MTPRAAGRELDEAHSASPLFFRRQTAGECGLCALNHALGAGVFDFNRLEHAVQVLVDESMASALEVGSIGWDSAANHMNVDGWFSEDS